jgi:hypothetical protein
MPNQSRHGPRGAKAAQWLDSIGVLKWWLGAELNRRFSVSQFHKSFKKREMRFTPW